jgi:hypothetical protein
VSSPRADEAASPGAERQATSPPEEPRQADGKAASGGNVGADSPEPDRRAVAAPAPPADGSPSARQAASSSDATLAREEAKAFARSVMDEPEGRKQASTAGAREVADGSRGAGASAPVAAAPGGPSAGRPAAGQSALEPPAGTAAVDSALQADRARRLRAFEEARLLREQYRRVMPPPMMPPPGYGGYPAGVPVPYPRPVYR